MTTWFVLAIALTPQFNDRGGGPCGKTSVAACLEISVKQMRSHGATGVIHAIAIHQEDWDKGNLAWDYYANRMVIAATGKPALCEFMSIKDPD